MAVTQILKSSSLSIAIAATMLLAAVPVSAPRASIRNAEDMMIVDCLLPGQVRKLGKVSTYMSARRPIRTIQSDCEIRGGEFVSYDRANYETALKVWMGQAESGDAEAQNYVGEIYDKGLGTAPDHVRAANWYEKSAAQGLKRAKINLGYLYEQGLGVHQGHDPRPEPVSRGLGADRRRPDLRLDHDRCRQCPRNRDRRPASGHRTTEGRSCGLACRE